jgi:hypothetical protein
MDGSITLAHKRWGQAGEMGMSIRGFVRKALSRAALMLMAGIGFGGAAAASTIYTYSFTQAYTYGFSSENRYPATLTGGFTGTADASGHINLGTLSDFHLNIDTSIYTGSYSGLPDYFSFLVGDASGSSLGFQSPVIVAAPPSFALQICVGLPVAALCNGGTARGVYSFVGVGSYATSDIAPVVTLVSSSTVATTPIPGALLLFITALAGLGAAGAWWRKRNGASA